MDQIEVSHSATELWALIRLTGEIDLAAAQRAVNALNESVRTVAPPTSVVIDLTEVSFLAVSGARAVLGFADSCAGRGLDTRLVSDPDGVVTRVLRLSSHQAVLPVYDTLAAALPPEPDPRYRA